jgi:hypothetical protein
MRGDDAAIVNSERSRRALRAIERGKRRGGLRLRLAGVARDFMKRFS